MKKIKLDNGFECSIDVAVFDDMRLVDLINEIDEKPMLIGKLATLILGQTQKDALYKHIEKDGRVSIQDFSNAITELMSKSTEGKKS